MALSRDLDEEAAYQEEELKRLRSTLGEGAEIGFSYDAPRKSPGSAGDPSAENMEKSEEVECDEPFVAPHDLHVPSDLTTVRWFLSGFSVKR
jgi:hypothetical protein